MASREPDTTPLHPIRVVSRRTGLSQDILRIWERRYEAVVPTRGETGRRLYTELDVERLILLARLVDGGRRISDVARLSYDELRSLFGADEAAAARAPQRRGAGDAVDPQEHLDRAVEAIENLDRDALERALSMAATAMPPPLLRRSVIGPLLETIGDRWQDGSLRIAHEHMASAIVRRFVDSMRNRIDNSGASKLVIATPSGQRHELGALMVAATAEEAGWDGCYLGSDLPAEEIAAAARQTGARVVALSVVYEGNGQNCIDELKKIRKLTPSDIQVVVGGRAVESARTQLEDAGIRCAEDVDDFVETLTTLAR